MATLNPYISFDGKAREALEFYHSVLGGEISMDTFAGAGFMPVEPGQEELIMHGQVTTDDGLVLMASDTPAGMTYTAPSAGVTIAHTGAAAEKDVLTDRFARLSEGGTVQMPLEKAPWGAYFGSFTDRFGVSWMFNINAEEA